ncbi:putative integral membrane protein [Aspergillus undulatus]|uniref:putative integral membrane protein n=1 Tax=Aspergillus undulatus TaxID=1810928 RepID=UPI003CCE51B7
MSDSDDQSVELRAIIAVLFTIAGLTMILRCYVRGWVVNAFGWDDGAMVLAMPFLVIYTVCLVTATFYGLDRRSENLTVNQQVISTKMLMLAQIGWRHAINVCKISVCIFLTRITIKPLHTWLVYAVLIWLAAHSIPIFAADMSRCRPFSYLWNRLARDPSIEGTCMTNAQFQAIGYTTTASLTFTDIVVGIVLPIMIIHKVQMPKASKIAVIRILSLACVSTAAGVVRLPYMLSYAHLAVEIFSISVWAYVEISLVIIAGNLATFGPLFRIWFGILSSHDHTPTTPVPRQPRRSGPRGHRDLSYPLSSFDETARSRLRLDKLSTTVTHIAIQRHSDLPMQVPAGSN